MPQAASCEQRDYVTKSKKITYINR